MDQDIEKKILRNAVARLESQMDHLEAEFSYLNALLIKVGFQEGIETLKKTAEELIEEKKLELS